MQKYSVRIILKKRENALRNARRQKARVETGKDVRVNPSFWYQVARDYMAFIKPLLPQNYKKLLRENKPIPVCSRCESEEFVCASNIVTASCAKCGLTIA